MEELKLAELYNQYLEHYKMTGEKEHPARLLSLLLLQEKDNYEPLMVEEGKFYSRYKKEIDIKINKVIKDFNITKEEIVAYIKQTIIYDEANYEKDKIWFVFAEGFGNMHWGIMYRKDATAEEIYTACYGNKKAKIKTISK